MTAALNTAVAARYALQAARVAHAIDPTSARLLDLLLAERELALRQAELGVGVVRDPLDAVAAGEVEALGNGCFRCKRLPAAE